jgi:uncharacterized protein (TIGR03086 family)
MSAPIDDVTALERAYDDLTRVVSHLDLDELSTPTLCSDWDVRGLLNHVLGTAVMFTAANAGQAVGEDAGDLVGDDPVGAVKHTAVANLAAWRQNGALEGSRTYPWGTFPAPIGLVINISEVAVHAWDLARASGQHAHIDAAVAAPVYELYRQMRLGDLRTKGVFGAEVTVPATAPVQDRLLGLLGRAA